MQTIIYKEIEGYKIIIGYSKLSINPVETQKVVNGLIEEEENTKRIKTLKIQMNTLNKQIFEIKKSAIKGLLKEQEEQIENYQNQIQEILVEIINAEDIKKKRIIELKKENAVYFPPAKYELIKTDEEIKTLRAVKLTKNQLLDVDGNIVNNYTGISWWIKTDKWQVVKCKLGEIPPAGGKEYKDLTESEKQEINEQNEKDRILSLNITEKEKEKQNKIDAAGIEAAQKRSILEIQGIPADDALNQVQEWYNQEVAILEEKYK